MRKPTLAVIGLFLILYILPLGWRSLAIPDEARYGEIPREMMASGDWVVPRLNGLKYFEKPVLGYWLNAASIALLGENAFSVRLMSALSTGMTALIIFFLMTRFGGGPRAGAIGASAYLTCVLVLALGVISTLDSMLTLLLTGAMAFFFFAYREDIPVRRAGFLAFFGAFCGLAFLLKGFLAFAVPLITIVPFLIWEGRLKAFIRWWWIPLLALLVVALPWCILIHLREGDFWRYFFWVEHVQRFVSPIPGQHAKPFWYFLPVLAGGSIPWVILLPATFSETRVAVRRKDPLVRYATCWLLFPFIFFSGSGGKLVPYVLPCFAPLVILIVSGLMTYLESGKTRAFNICAVSLAILIAAFVSAAILIQAASIQGMRLYDDPSELWKFIAAVTGFLAWGAGAILAARAKNWRKKVALFIVAPLPVLLGAHMVIPNHALDDRAPERALLQNQDKVRADTVILSGEQTVHAVCWFYKRDDVYLLENGGELTYGLNRDDSHPPRLVMLADLREFIRAHTGKGGVVLFLTLKNYRKLKDRLPEPTFQDSGHGFIFLKYP